MSEVTSVYDYRRTHEPYPVYPHQGGDVLTLGLEGITVSYKLNGKVIRRFTQWNIRAWRLCIKFGTGETHITGLTVNGELIPDFTHSGNVQVENPKTNTALFTVHVGSECDPTLPNRNRKEGRFPHRLVRPARKR